MSIRKIAKHANVSIATVSRVLNDKPDISVATRDRVLRAVNKAQYFSTVGKRVTTNVALAYTKHGAFHAFDALLMSGILKGLNEHRFDLTVVNLERDKKEDETYTQFFQRKSIRGVLVRVLGGARHVAEAIAKEGIASVALAESFADPAVSFITSDSRHNSRIAVEHLIDLGHRRIGVAVHSVMDSDHADRVMGYREALLGAGLPVDESLMVPIVADVKGGTSAVNRFMSMPNPPTAIYFTDPLPAVGALRRAAMVGLKVPEELSVVGFDDNDMRHEVYPTLTAVCQDVAAMGCEAAVWLTRNVMGIEGGPMRRVLPTLFEVNSTTSSPPERAVRMLPQGTRVEVGVGA